MTHELKPGHSPLSYDLRESRVADGDVQAGDAVTFGTDGVMEQAEDGEFNGIAAHDGDNNGLGNANVLQGVVVANVAADVDAGNRLDTSATAGELAEVDGGPVLALSDEGGTWHGSQKTYSVPEGYAVVYTASGPSAHDTGA